MYNKPFLSVLMAVNRDDGSLKQTIESILVQSYSNFEFLIVNDGKNLSVIKTLKKIDDIRIKLHNIDKCGLTNALNFGLFNAQGEYIARQDAGDISLQFRFEKQIDVINKHPDYALIGTSIRNESLSGDFIGNTIFPSSDEDIKSHIAFQNTFWHGTVIFKKKVSDELNGYREPFKLAQDYDFWLRICEKYPVYNLAEILYIRTIDKNSISLKTKNIQAKYGEIARNFYKARLNNLKEDFSKLHIMDEYYKNGQVSKQRTNSDYYFYCGRLMLTERNKKNARKYFIISLKYRPFAVIPIIFLIFTFIPSNTLDIIERKWKFVQKILEIQLD